MADWLKAGAIPNDDELKAQLIGPEYSENAQGIILEEKKICVPEVLPRPILLTPLH